METDAMDNQGANKTERSIPPQVHTFSQQGDGEGPLHRAVRNCDIRRVASLLKDGADISALDRYGITPPLQAAMDGNEAAMQLFINHGVDVNAADPEGRTCIIWASIRNRRGTVAILIEAGADTNAGSQYGRTPMIEAAMRGYYDIVYRLINAGASLNTTAEEGSTALHFALRKGHRAVASLLIDSGANVSIRNRAGFTPLLIAARKGFDELVKKIVAEGADPRETDADGHSPLYWANHRRFREISEFLSRVLFGINEAAAEGDVAQIVDFIKKGANINTRDQYDETPLHRAAWEGHTDVVQILIDGGADIAAVTNYGKTPLHRACRAGNLEIVRILLDSGAPIDARNAEGETPLHWAAFGGNLDIVSLLIKKGANPFVRNHRHRRLARDVASGQGHLHVVEWLDENVLTPNDIVFEQYPLAETEDWVLEAWLGDEIVGKANFTKTLSNIVIKFITIHERYRRRGIGRQMVEFLSKKAPLSIVKKVRRDARPFWDALGFEKRDNYFVRDKKDMLP